MAGPIIREPEPAVAERPVVDDVSEKLWAVILDGTFGPGARLPAERELAAQLGASRVSVRTAIRGLVEAGVIATRRGSGATVLPRRSWNSKVLAWVLRREIEASNWSALVPIVQDGFFIRRTLVLEVVGRAATQVVPGTLAAPRAAVELAWENRREMGVFAHEDRKIIPLVLEAAGMLSSLWLLNSLADAYLGVMAIVAHGTIVPESYVPAHLSMLDALEAGDEQGARRHLAGYLDELDVAIVTSLPEGLRDHLFGRGERR